jgi:enediyne biosynthesis protein E4
MGLIQNVFDSNMARSVEKLQRLIPEASGWNTKAWMGHGSSSSKNASLPRAPRTLAIAAWIASAMTLPLASVSAAPWQSGNGFRFQTLEVPSSGRTYLQRLPPAQTGINFTNYVSDEKGLENSLRTSGAGIAAGDIDGDGWCDLYFCGMETANALYRNLGNGKFSEVAASAGVACEGQYSTGAVLADIDGDGDLDLAVNSLGGGTRLFLNDGKGKFAEATDTGLVRKFGSTSMALADIDGNGSLDLYVCNYATVKIEDRPNAKFEAKTVSGKPVLVAIDGVPLTSPELTNRYYVDSERVVRELGEPDILYLNDGHGRFKAVSWTDGSFLDTAGKPLTLPPYDFGLSVMFRDMNGDLAPDLYICNDLFPPDRIWINDGRGRFRAMSNLAVRNTCRFAMGVDFADINRDGYDDFFVVDMLSRDHANRKLQTVGVLPLFLPIGEIDNRPQYKRNTLFLNRGDGTYAEIAQLSGLDATEWSWMPAFLDVDLDGYEDALVTTGHVLDSLNADAVAEILRERRTRKLSDAEQRALKRKYYPTLRLQNQAFRNRGDLTFQDSAREWGFDYVGISQGLCLADLDNDGDQDVVVNHLNDSAGIYRNETTARRVAVRLKGKAPNTRGIGARIKFLGGPVPQTQEIQSGGRYLSSDDPMRMFAAGKGASGFSIEVTWRNGAISLVNDVEPNRLYEVDEAGARNVPNPKSKTEPGGKGSLFTDASQSINHTHEDAWFDDFARQPLLSKKLSQSGPGVSWADIDGDGWEDLIVGGGVGGRMAVFRNDRKGGFAKLEAAVLKETLGRDQTTILGWRKSTGSTVLLAGTSNYEAEQPGGRCVREFDLNQPVVGGTFPGWEISVGPLAMADLDGNGELDLLVGGRVEPRRYPDPPSSLMFRSTGDQFAIDEENCRRLGLVGLVSGAVFTDLDSDGDSDLVLACEWGPLRIFRNDQGRLALWDWRLSSGDARFTTLSKLTGWWNGVTSGDFDGDGQLDLVASNWGRNSRYEGFRAQPLRTIYGEWTAKGVVDVFDAYFDNVSRKAMPWCSYAVARLLPWIGERFPTQTAFASAGMADILRERGGTAKSLEATWLETSVFLNRGDHFELRPLPIEAQFSPAFGVNVGDLDGDGTEDIFLSQNFFAVDGDTSRYDAGRGLCLAGDGQGNFRPMPGQQSGVQVYGEQRGSALADFDRDGRVDLVVSQNGAETKLYRNTGAKPGLLVRLAGPAGNASGVGAVLRLISGKVTGPAREIHAGSGYWSQDSAVQVLCGPEQPTQLWVRWPGGKVTTTDLPAGAREIAVDVAGKLVNSK